MKRHLVPTVVLALAACSTPPSQVSKSNLANLDIGELKTTGDGLPLWTSMTLDVRRADDGVLTKSLSALKSQFEGGKSSFASVKLTYGRYLFDLQYKNADGVLVYESCNKAEIQDIEKPVYTASVNICLVGGQTPVGSTPIEPTSDVVIEPRATTANPGTPAPSQPDPGNCSIGEWRQGQTYEPGDKVRFRNGTCYVATHENPGYDPTISTWFWTPLSSCDRQ